MIFGRAAVPPLYAITDASRGSHAVLAETLIAAGVQWIQLRDKGRDDRTFFDEVTRVAGSLPAKVQLFVNDRADIALAGEADGVHLGDRDLPPSVVRDIAGSRALLIGLSSHSEEEALAAAADEAVDYVAIGPIFRSPTKNVREPLGLEVIRRIRERISKPIVAIGGIDRSNIASVLTAGADSAAVISALYEGDIASSVDALLSEAARVRA